MCSSSSSCAGLSTEWPTDLTLSVLRCALLPIGTPLRSHTPDTPALKANQLSSLPYFLSLASLTIYIGAHRGLNARQRQQIALREGLLAPVGASGETESARQPAQAA